MKTGKLVKRMTAGVLSVLMLLTLVFSGTVFASESEITTLTFSDSGITETVAGSGYSISGTTLSITAAGTYIVTGSCSEGSIEVAKELSDVVLILDDLSLTSTTTAPIAVKKTSSVTIHLEGESTLTDNEDASTEDTNEDFEGAAIKVKTGSSVTFCGEGTLNVNGTAKNGIKGGTDATLTFNGGTYNVTAANNGIASDGELILNAGTYVINAENDGLKAVPDADDTTSAGNLTINGGAYTIDVNGDGIQAEQNLTINNGVFIITTFDGYNTSGFDEDTMSCKGIKASGDREDIENTLLITGGSFTLNTRDDAVHSDGSVTITGGTLAIQTGDDGVHAETALTLGTENGYERDPEITITNSYEGLEGGNVYIYSGKHYVTASDDGINAAGGSTNGTDAGTGGGDQFRPGGGPGGQSGFPGQQTTTVTGTSDYNIYIYGGDIYVDCLGDGLDSNGGLYLTGGNITVFSMQSGGDNSPIDADGTVSINGATLCAAGSAGMMALAASCFGQKYYQTTSANKNAGTVIDIYHNNSLVYSDKLPRNISYLLYTSPSMTSNSCSVQTASSVTACKSNAWAHDWDDGTVVTEATESAAGVMKYTCSDCSDTEYKSIVYTGSYNCSGHESSSTGGGTTDDDDDTDEGYAVTFAAGTGVKSINVYYTQDYTAASESGVTSTVSRDSDTGEADSSGTGQVNFAVELEDGYTLSADQITISGEYKNLKDVSSESGVSNTYRVTKITSALTITVTPTASSGGGTTDDDDDTDEGYAVTFAAGTGVKSINVYYTQDYTAASESGVTSTVSRNSDTGEADSTGTGQVNFAVELEDGYTLSADQISITGTYKNLKDVSEESGISNTYRVTKITTDLTITVTPTASSSDDDDSVFDDVNEGDWFYEVVMEAYNYTNANGTRLISGYADSNNFGPNDPLTRSQFAVILNRLADDDTTGSAYDASIFADVEDNWFYTSAVMWANYNGVITGYGNGYFGVTDYITREQVATILYRYATQYLGKNVDAALAAGDLTVFSDSSSVSEFAEEALIWATGAGIILGNDNGTLDPQGNATRAQGAAMFMRFLSYIAGLS